MIFTDVYSNKSKRIDFFFNFVAIFIIALTFYYMGRKKKYLTEEDRLASNRLRAKKWISDNKDRHSDN